MRPRARTCLPPALAATAALALGGAAAADAPASADLAIAISSNLKRVKPHHQVFFTLKVTNRGPDPETGAVIALQLHNGLVHPKLVAASPDSVVTSCAPAPSGAPPSCSSRWVPPDCQVKVRYISCHYRDFQFAPPGQNANSISLSIRAATGKRTPETAVATVTGSAVDPNRADNRAARRLQIKRA